MSGDGGFSMMMGDFISLTQLGLPVKVIVLNNGTLGFVEMEMKASGFLDTGCRAQEPQLRRHGRGHGHQGRARRGAATTRGRAAPRRWRMTARRWSTW